MSKYTSDNEEENCETEDTHMNIVQFIFRPRIISFFLLMMIPLLICTIAAVLLALVLEFFAFGGDYSRAERLEYEDDEYFYYVKAVPKASVATSERSIKKINAEPVREERKAEDNSGTYANPIFRQDEKPKRKKASPVADRKPRQAEKPAAKDVDFEKKLEESLKDL